MGRPEASLKMQPSASCEVFGSSAIVDAVSIICFIFLDLFVPCGFLAFIFIVIALPSSSAIRMDTPAPTLTPITTEMWTLGTVLRELFFTGMIVELQAIFIPDTLELLVLAITKEVAVLTGVAVVELLVLVAILVCVGAEDACTGEQLPDKKDETVSTTSVNHMTYILLLHSIASYLEL